jgi:hypothetical protein
MKTLIVIMGYGGRGQKVFNRHLPHWKRHGLPLLVCSPEDARLCTSEPALVHGRSRRNGKAMTRRLRHLFQCVAGMDFERAVFFEYDSLCLSRTLPDLVCAGNIRRNEDPAFVAESFPHWPIFMSHAVVEKVAAVLATAPDEVEGGWPDRLLGWAWQAGGIVPHNFLAGGGGFSRHTISPPDFPLLANCLKAGATMIHGIKSVEALEICRPFFRY